MIGFSCLLAQLLGSRTFCRSYCCVRNPGLLLGQFDLMLLARDLEVLKFMRSAATAATAVSQRSRTRLNTLTPISFVSLVAQRIHHSKRRVPPWFNAEPQTQGAHETPEKTFPPLPATPLSRPLFDSVKFDHACLKFGIWNKV